MEIALREERLPGIGVRWQLELPGGDRLYVIAERSGRRHLGVVRKTADEPDCNVELDQHQAMTVAALLLGARFSLDASDAPHGDMVVVETVELGPSSPALGQTLAEVTIPQHDAVVLAIIDDETPELLEHAVERRCRPGDRLVIAARARDLESIARQLRGDETG